MVSGQPSMGGWPSGQGLAASHAQPPARQRRAVVLPGAARQRLLEREHMLHVAAERARSPSSRMLNSIGATMAGVGTVPKLLSGMRSTSAITVMPPPGHT